LAFVAGCSSSSPSPVTLDGGPDPVKCTVGLLGDGGAPDFSINVLQPDDTVTPIVQGDAVPLIFPPQGGRVVFVGVRATNVNGCALQLTGAIRDLHTQEVNVDSRTTNLIPTGDGWGVSGQSGPTATAANFANVAVCPNEWASTSVYGNLFGLEVTVKDKDGRQLTKKLNVTPQCAQPENLSECLCICQVGYVLGQACNVDGGDQ